MKYLIIKEIHIDNGEVIREPLLDNEELLVFNNEIDANIERIYLQPDHPDLLKVYETKLGENK